MAFSASIRPITSDELDAFLQVHGEAFGAGQPSGKTLAQIRSRTEFDRTLAAFDGGTMAGTAGIYSLRMRVPGALVPVAGVTMIAVLPTHRRRGILSALLQQQFRDIAGRGEALAALFASEAGIYQRFGYGRASWHTYWTVRGGEGALAPGAPADQALRLRLAVPATSRAELAKVYEQALAERPGFFARNDAWWDRVLFDEGDERGNGTPLRCLLAEDDAGPRGYALFRAWERWDGPSFLPDSALEVTESVTADPAAAAAIWRDLLNRDLVATVRAPMRPVDDPLLHLLADPRRLRPQLSDGLWVRLADVGKALGLRRYACPADVVIDVTDSLLPRNTGRWRLATDGTAAACDRTTAAADVSLPVHALGAAYLGGTQLGTLARAGLVTEHTPGAVAVLSTAMSWDPAPWCPVIF
jgi:predicted acetyltransferase